MLSENRSYDHNDSDFLSKDQNFSSPAKSIKRTKALSLHLSEKSGSEKGKFDQILEAMNFDKREKREKDSLIMFDKQNPKKMNYENSIEINLNDLNSDNKSKNNFSKSRSLGSDSSISQFNSGHKSSYSYSSSSSSFSAKNLMLEVENLEQKESKKKNPIYRMISNEKRFKIMYFIGFKGGISEFTLFIILFGLKNRISEFKELLPIFISKYKRSHLKDELSNNIYSQVINLTKDVDDITLIRNLQHVFVNFVSEFLEKSITSQTFLVFKSIIDLLKDFQFDLITIKKNIMMQILIKKNLPSIIFMTENNIKIKKEKNNEKLEKGNKYKQILSFNSYFQTVTRVNLKLIVLYYVDEVFDKKFVKNLIVLVKEDLEEMNEIMKVCVEFHLNSLAREITRNLIEKGFKIDHIHFNFALKLRNFSYVWFLTQLEHINIWPYLQFSETQTLLVNSLYNAEGKNFEYILFFLKKIKLWLSRDSLKTIALALTSLLNYSVLKNNFLFSFTNPFKICILIIEMLENLFKKTLFNKSALTTIKNHYINFVKIYLKKIYDETLLFEIMRDVDIEGRKLIYIIFENNMYFILEFQNVKDVVEIMWNGNVICNNSIFSFFSITQSIMRLKYNKFLQREKKIFFVHNQKFLQQNFILQKSVWKYNCWLKNCIDQIMIIFFSLLYLIYFFDLFDYKSKIYLLQQKEGYDPFSSSTYHLQTKQLEEETTNILLNLMDNSKIFIYINLFFIINFPIKIISTIVYHKYKEKFVNFDFEDSAKLLFAFLCLINIVILTQLDHIMDPYRTMLMNFIDFISISLILLIVIFPSKTTKSLGPMVKALLNSTKTVTIYLTILIPSFFFFVLSGYILMDDLESGNFKSVPKSIFYLIESTFAQFSFEDFNFKYSVFGPIFLICFIIVIPTVLMNVLIAVLTQAFEGATRLGIVLFYHNLIGWVRRLEFDSEVGCLVSTPIALNGVNLIFFGFYVIKKKIETQTLRNINNIMTWIGYMFILALFTVILITINIILAPLCYFLNVIFMTYYILTKKTTFKLFSIWIILGFPLILYSILPECLIFWKHMINETRNLKENLSGITKENYSILRRVFLDLFKTGKETINLSDLLFFIKTNDKELAQKFNSRVDFSDDSDELDDLNLDNMEKIHKRLPLSNKLFQNEEYDINSNNGTSLIALKKGASMIFIATNEKIQKFSVKELLESHLKGIDSDNFYEFLEKLMIKTKEMDFELEEKSAYCINIKNALKLMKYYGKKEIKLTNYNTLNLCLNEYFKSQRQFVKKPEIH